METEMVLLPKFIRETRQMVIDQMLRGIEIPSHSSVLEPSAGTGDLVKGILKINNLLEIDCVELNKEKREILKEKGHIVIGQDFLKLKPHEYYDFVIATPTYKDNVDVDHIIHMYKFLKPGGWIISLTQPSWTVKNSDRQRNFREWLENKHYNMRMLKDFSFVENFETQPSMIINIYKNEWK